MNVFLVASGVMIMPPGSMIIPLSQETWLPLDVAVVCSGPAITGRSLWDLVAGCEQAHLGIFLNTCRRFLKDTDIHVSGKIVIIEW